MTFFNHVPVSLPEIKTQTINYKRFYITPEGEAYPSITTVLSVRGKEGLVEWRKRVGEKVANYVSGKARARGTAVHYMCEDYLNNQSLDFPSEFERHKKNFFPWCLFSQLKKQVLHNITDIYAQEVSLYSYKYKIGGRADCICKYKGVPSVIDFKTSTKERSDAWNEDYYIQASAYAEMFEERTGIEINQIVILVVTEDGTVQEFIKEKKNYLDGLLKIIQEWRKQNV